MQSAIPEHYTTLLVNPCKDWLDARAELAVRPLYTEHFMNGASARQLGLTFYATAASVRIRMHDSRSKVIAGKVKQHTMYLDRQPLHIRTYERTRDGQL